MKKRRFDPAFPIQENGGLPHSITRNSLLPDVPSAEILRAIFQHLRELPPPKVLDSSLFPEGEYDNGEEEQEQLQEGVLHTIQEGENSPKKELLPLSFSSNSLDKINDGSFEDGKEKENASKEAGRRVKKVGEEGERKRRRKPESFGNGNERCLPPGASPFCSASNQKSKDEGRVNPPSYCSGKARLNSFLVAQGVPAASRITSAFAAAKEKSMLGEALAFFAEAIRALLLSGPEVGVAIPEKWAAYVAEHKELTPGYLYELQGLSTLLTFVWGQVASTDCRYAWVWDRGMPAHSEMNKNKRNRDRTPSPRPDTSSSSSPSTPDVGQQSRGHNGGEGRKERGKAGNGAAFTSQRNDKDGKNADQEKREMDEVKERKGTSSQEDASAFYCFSLPSLSHSGSLNHDEAPADVPIVSSTPGGSHEPKASPPALVPPSLFEGVPSPPLLSLLHHVEKGEARPLPSSFIPPSRNDDKSSLSPPRITPHTSFRLGKESEDTTVDNGHTTAASTGPGTPIPVSTGTASLSNGGIRSAMKASSRRDGELSAPLEQHRSPASTSGAVEEAPGASPVVNIYSNEKEDEDTRGGRKLTYKKRKPSSFAANSSLNTVLTLTSPKFRCSHSPDTTTNEESHHTWNTIGHSSSSLQGGSLPYELSNHNHSQSLPKKTMTARSDDPQQEEKTRRGERFAGQHPHSVSSSLPWDNPLDPYPEDPPQDAGDGMPPGMIPTRRKAENEGENDPIQAIMEGGGLHASVAPHHSHLPLPLPPSASTVFRAFTGKGVMEAKGAVHTTDAFSRSLPSTPLWLPKATKDEKEGGRKQREHALLPSASTEKKNPQHVSMNRGGTTVDAEKEGPNMGQPPSEAKRWDRGLEHRSDNSDGFVSSARGGKVASFLSSAVPSSTHQASLVPGAPLSSPSSDSQQRIPIVCGSKLDNPSGLKPIFSFSLYPCPPYRTASKQEVVRNNEGTREGVGKEKENKREASEKGDKTVSVPSSEFSAPVPSQHPFMITSYSKQKELGGQGRKGGARGGDAPISLDNGNGVQSPYTGSLTDPLLSPQGQDGACEEPKTGVRRLLRGRPHNRLLASRVARQTGLPAALAEHSISPNGVWLDASQGVKGDEMKKTSEERNGDKERRRKGGRGSARGRRRPSFSETVQVFGKAIPGSPNSCPPTSSHIGEKGTKEKREDVLDLKNKTVPILYSPPFLPEGILQAAAAAIFTKLDHEYQTSNPSAGTPSTFYPTAECSDDGAALQAILKVVPVPPSTSETRYTSSSPVPKKSAEVEQKEKQKRLEERYALLPDTSTAASPLCLPTVAPPLSDPTALRAWLHTLQNGPATTITVPSMTPTSWMGSLPSDPGAHQQGSHSPLPHGKGQLLSSGSSREEVPTALPLSSLPHSSSFLSSVLAHLAAAAAGAAPTASTSSRSNGKLPALFSAAPTMKSGILPPIPRVSNSSKSVEQMIEESRTEELKKQLKVSQITNYAAERDIDDFLFGLEEDLETLFNE